MEADTSTRTSVDILELVMENMGVEIEDMVFNWE